MLSASSMAQQKDRKGTGQVGGQVTRQVAGQVMEAICCVS